MRVRSEVLDIDCCAERIDGTWKLSEDCITSGVENAAVGSCYEIFKDRTIRHETTHRLLFILGHKPTIPNDISSEYGRNFTLHNLPR